MLNASKKIEENFFELLNEIDDNTNKKKVDLAIERAERNYNHLDHTNAAKEESSTTVFKLVGELLKYV